MQATSAGVASMTPKSSFLVRCAALAEEVIVKNLSLKATVVMNLLIMLIVCQHATCVRTTTETAGECVLSALKKFLETWTLSLLILNLNQNLLVLLVKMLAMSANSRTWNAGRDAMHVLTHTLTKTTMVKMDLLLKMRRPPISMSVIAISWTMPVGRIVTEKRRNNKRNKRRRAMGRITTERI